MFEVASKRHALKDTRPTVDNVYTITRKGMPASPTYRPSSRRRAKPCTCGPDGRIPFELVDVRLETKDLIVAANLAGSPDGRARGGRARRDAVSKRVVPVLKTPKGGARRPLAALPNARLEGHTRYEGRTLFGLSACSVVTTRSAYTCSLQGLATFSTIHRAGPFCMRRRSELRCPPLLGWSASALRRSKGSGAFDRGGVPKALRGPHPRARVVPHAATWSGKKVIKSTTVESENRRVNPDTRNSTLLGTRSRIALTSRSFSSSYKHFIARTVPASITAATTRTKRHP